MNIFDVYNLFKQQKELIIKGIFQINNNLIILKNEKTITFNPTCACNNASFV